MAKKEIHYDVRVSHRYIKDGIITQKDYDNHMKKLPDVSENATTLVLEEGEEDIAEVTDEAENIEEQD